MVQKSVSDCSWMDIISGGRTVISSLKDDMPIALDAMIVNDLGGDSWPGVPEITPESGSIERPSGKDGLTAHELGASPRKLGVSFWISFPVSRVIADSPKSSISGLIMVRHDSPVKTWICEQSSAVTRFSKQPSEFGSVAQSSSAMDSTSLSLDDAHPGRRRSSEMVTARTCCLCTYLTGGAN